ncbi:MAG: GNAT family protein [Candidatus Baltobacteraceae bacterium]
MKAKILQGRLCRLRPYRLTDAPALQALADDFLVARWMTSRFPHPYTQRDAEEWVARAVGGTRGHNVGIEVDGHLAGGAGIEPCDGEQRGVGVFGYWLGRAYWGRGIATDAARTLADYALAAGGLHRLEATVFVQNVASARVLEKAGFTREGTLRARYVDRDGALCDALIYARLAALNPP